ncbi:hypothetical protein IV417_15640 [Alphaproteobacteria bacterium KMM 3653]|uniref:Transmembrane protein n=1 Tax=Harenicola maris TaxID=2841044 RepID=A0AAP2CQT1_9RHOB|nr:hypothetical protein [Harenicola maris]
MRKKTAPLAAPQPKPTKDPSPARAIYLCVVLLPIVFGATYIHLRSQVPAERFAPQNTAEARFTSRAGTWKSAPVVTAPGTNADTGSALPQVLRFDKSRGHRLMERQKLIEQRQNGGAEASN